MSGANFIGVRRRVDESYAVNGSWGRAMRTAIVGIILVLAASSAAVAAQRIHDSDVVVMAQGLMAAAHDQPQPGKAIADYLQHEAERRRLDEAFIVDAHGAVLVSTVRRGASAFPSPTPDVMMRARARGGVIAYRDGHAHNFAVTWLSSFNDAYLVVATD